MTAVDLVRVGDTTTWCVVVKRGRGRNQPNHCDTACGDRVLVTTAGIEIRHGAAIGEHEHADICSACRPIDEFIQNTPALEASPSKEPMQTTTITELAPADIRRSPHNHRKTFNGIDELAASLKAKGLINPITVRPVADRENFDPQYELVAGERRWRAAKVAKLQTIPAIVRELSDLEVLEVQLIENVQREDVHPLEEADGYEELMSKHGFDVDQIAAKTGKSRATIYARLKLCSLAPYPREAFLENRLNASIALLIARIADVELQERATKDVLGETDFEDVAEDDSPLGNALGNDLDDPTSPLAIERRTIRDPSDEPDPFAKPERVPMSVREAQIHLRRRYMLRLELATFQLADPQLVPAAGACTTCEFRTGNQRELFADVDSADICTKPSCYEAKTAAAWEVQAATAREVGVKVIEAGDASKVFTASAQVRPTSPYVDPQSTVPMDLLPAGTTKAPTWEKFLGKKLADQAPFVLVQDLSGAGHQLLDKNAAVKVLREAGKIDKPLKPDASKSSSSSTKDPFKDQAAKDLKKREQWTRAGQAALAEAWTVAAKLDPKDPEWWKWITTALVGLSSYDLHGTDVEVKDLVERASSIGAYMRLITAILLNDSASIPKFGAVYQDPAKDKHVMSGFEMLGIDYDAHLERIKASDKEASKAEKKIAEKEPAKPAKKKGKAK